MIFNKSSDLISEAFGLDEIILGGPVDFFALYFPRETTYRKPKKASKSKKKKVVKKGGPEPHNHLSKFFP